MLSINKCSGTLCPQRLTYRADESHSFLRKSPMSLQSHTSGADTEFGEMLNLEEKKSIDFTKWFNKVCFATGLQSIICLILCNMCIRRAHQNVYFIALSSIIGGSNLFIMVQNCCCQTTPRRNCHSAGGDETTMLFWVLFSWRGMGTMRWYLPVCLWKHSCVDSLSTEAHH